MLSLLFCLLAGAYAVPNLVIVMVDDLGYGDLPQFDTTTPLTNPSNDQTLTPFQRKDLPNIQCLADSGMKFTDFHTAATLCTPSRAAMMTGRLPWRSQMTHTIFEVFTSASQLGGFPAEEVTLPEALKRAPVPYKTGMVGKWHLGVNDAGIDRSLADSNEDGVPDTLEYTWDPNNPGNTPANNPNRFNGSFLPQHQGFQYSELVNTLGNFGSCAPKRDSESLDDYNNRIHSYCFLMGIGSDGLPRVTEKPWDVEGLPQRMVNHFKKFLSENVETSPPTGQTAHPYFWYHAFMQVHTPYFASAAFNGKNDKDFTDMLEEMDYGVGLLMNEIKAHDAKHGTKTVVIFTSDNGAFYEDYYDTNGGKDATLGQSSSLPYKGGKGVMFEGGSRVPTIAWSNDANLVTPSWNHKLFSMMDLFPTFLKLAGFTSMPPPAAPGHPVYPTDDLVNGWKPVDGYDISTHLKSPSTVSPWENRLLPYYCGQELQAGRMGHYKAIWTQQLFVNASTYESDGEFDARNFPTPTTECDGGSCCPVPPGATGTCSCGDHIAFVDPDTGAPVIDEMAYRVRQHHREPLLFNLNHPDKHEDCNIKDGNDPDTGAISTVPNCVANPNLYQQTVGLMNDWHDYYNLMFQKRFPPLKKNGKPRKPRNTPVGVPKNSYVTPLALPPYYDDLVQPHCLNQPAETNIYACDYETTPFQPAPTGIISGFC